MTSTITTKSRAGVSPVTVLRCITGFFYLPHVWSKVDGFDGTVAFFAKAGFHPASAFVILSGCMELAIGLALLFGVLTKYASLLSFVLMLVAAYAVIVVKGDNWYWNVGGIEYLIFWALASLIVFGAEWREQPGVLGQFK